MTTVAVGYDFSAHARHAGEWAAAYAQRCGADVVLVHAIGLREHGEPSDPMVALTAVAAEIAAAAGLDVARVGAAVDYGDACSVLLRCAAAPLSASLLVVGTRGHREHAGFLLGSTSLELAEHATIPLVIVPPDA
jgi:nucleotide-binding universal stress UspA family protein